MCLPIIPTFVLPYKRYAGPTLLYLAATYVENQQQSYRQTTKPGNRVFGYVTPPGCAIDERALDHTTVVSSCRRVGKTLSREILHSFRNTIWLLLIYLDL